MKKLSILFFTLFILIFSPRTALAQGDRIAENLQCKVNIYQVFRNSSLPYQSNGSLVPSGTRTNFDSYYIYSLDLKNSLAIPPYTKISSVFTTNINGVKEPISVLDYRMYPQGSICIKNMTNNTVSCNSDFQSLGSTNGFMQMLVKINRFPSDLYNTSTLFTINTDQGKVECANMLMLDQSLPVNTDSPISWKTQFASISSRNFSIQIGNNKFFLGKEPVAVHSDGYGDGSDDTYTTLESTWYEDAYGYDTNHVLNPIEMRMNMYFKRDGNNWKLTELRTYNGEQQGDWLYYTARGGEISATVGSSYHGDIVFQATNGVNAQILCSDCDINAFMTLASQNHINTHAISSTSEKSITLSNEPGTSYTIKVSLLSRTPIATNNLSYEWNYIPAESLNLENLSSDHSIVSISSSKVGSTKLRVGAYDNSGGNHRLLASKDFEVTIIDSTTTSPGASCVFANQPILRSQNATCCAGLSLVSSSDQREDIVGYCIDKNSSETQFNKLQEELNIVKARLEQTEQKQTALQRMITDFQASIRKILKFLRLSP